MYLYTRRRRRTRLYVAATKHSGIHKTDELFMYHSVVLEL